MDLASQPSASDEGAVTVRYWGAARAGAGVESDTVPLQPDATLADVLLAVRREHADRPRLAEVLGVCSILVGDRPVGSADPTTVRLSPGDVVELLPPFAGGADAECGREQRG